VTLRRRLRTLGWATRGLVVRLLREPILIRSLIWPPAVVVGALGGTIALALALAAPPRVGLTAEAQKLGPALAAEGWVVVVGVTDPDAAVQSGSVTAATDGVAIWTRGDATAVERVLRRATGAAWYPASAPPVDAAAPEPATETLGGWDLFAVPPRLIALLYTLYGAVFGLASVARDRDDGSLQAELATGNPWWVFGAARWLAPTLVLGVAASGTIALLGAILGGDSTGAIFRHAWASVGGATAVGLIAVGHRGMAQGMSTALSAALVAVTALIAVGVRAPALGVCLPIASLAAGGEGWLPLGGAVLAGGASAMAFARSAGRA
jgi:hypothetical protein